jgi:hypothetical protein
MTSPDPELPDQVLGATVRYGPIGPPDPDAFQMGEQAWILPDAVWVQMLELKLMIRGTDEVVVEIPDGADRSLVAPLLYGWATRVLMLHAGIFNLHGSLVRIGDEHVVIGGHSGAGKSTTVVHLAKDRGATVLIDDVVHVELVDGRPVARPFPRPVHLTHDAIARLGIVDGGEQVGQGPFSKLAVEIAEASGPVPIDRLVTLVAYDPSPSEDWPNTIIPSVLPTADRPVVVRDIAGAERLRWVVRLANNSGLSSFGPRAEMFFQWSTSLASALPTSEIARLRSADTLDAVCDLLTSSSLGRVR